MSHTYAELRVHNLRLLKHEDVKLLVDTGSTYTWISKSILERLEIKPRGTRRFKTIDGRLLERNVSETMVRMHE
ncbi:MAG: retropepsin-like aspartic protease [Nitrososphaerales archaeon]